MSRFPLQTVLDLSQLRMDEAARRLGELISGEQQAEERLNMLIQYRDEYHQRFLAAARDGIDQNTWHNYQGFLGRLDEAIGQARGQVEASRQRTAVGKDEWLNNRGRVKAFDTLAKRHQGRAVYAENRQEQKLLDEHSARIASQKSGE